MVDPPVKGWVLVGCSQAGRTMNYWFAARDALKTQIATQSDITGGVEIWAKPQDVQPLLHIVNSIKTYF